MFVDMLFILVPIILLGSFAGVYTNMTFKKKIYLRGFLSRELCKECIKCEFNKIVNLGYSTVLAKQINRSKELSYKEWIWLLNERIHLLIKSDAIYICKEAQSCVDARIELFIAEMIDIPILDSENIFKDGIYIEKRLHHTDVLIDSGYIQESEKDSGCDSISIDFLIRNGDGDFQAFDNKAMEVARKYKLDLGFRSSHENGIVHYFYKIYF